MKKVLFCVQGLWLGGTEKTLIEALEAIDYTEYDITLYSRNNYTDLLDSVPKQINVLINQTYKKEEIEKKVLWIKKISNTFRTLGLTGSARRINSYIEMLISKKLRKLEQNRYFSTGDDYDIAIAYDMAIDCAKFVLENIKSKKKIVWFHSSKLEKKKYDVFCKFDQIVCVNSVVAEKMCSDYPNMNAKIIAIENYLSPDTVFDKLNNLNDNLAEERTNKLVLCTCGRIWHLKRYDLAVKAAVILKKKEIDFKWYFVGDGEQKNEILDLIRNENLDENIILTGFTDNPYRYTYACDIYVQTSEQEAHATTILEAIIMGKPVISTNTCAGRYFNQKYKCCNVVELSAEAIATEIIRLYQSNELQFLRYSACSVNWGGIYDAYKKNISDLLNANS